MSGKINGVEVLSNISGLSQSDVRDIWAQVKANKARIDGCHRHHFTDETARIGQKLTCAECGGVMSLSDVGAYIRGYVAHGGNAADIWPAWANSKPHQERSSS